MRRPYYLIALKIKGESVLIAGGGKVAKRKAEILLKSGAKVKIVSPEITEGLRRIISLRKVRWIKRKIRPSDLAGAKVVIAATSDSSVNKKVSGWAEKRGILVNVVDRAELSSFISPAIFTAPKAIVAVYTEGRDPALSRDLKNFLKENWDAFLSYRHRL
ncbi:MAG: bifunctional precorrin-2 dehydrogenase/sirohydrochlorin ferrochelatase [Candidatus Omnitrophica bacterium]|nr:bifunctional precorrin-2 dehydrogenase/sirohydrochlorin ferrochelatase [Candidatus Omnitrophota bacterium]MBU4487584.1 bifunctional precorrin-2 dehydrogenase/sirohydrochlorin ferrochelatase [Candidatus Omnitrophota bacterium]MCG2705190.1 bifunctional precorrin-2 dehydrogenase/sirohydrochlorin ferrochelatase [Candidatus Omnitrophota bacterium]